MPFSDHVALLTENDDALQGFVSFLERKIKTRGYRYVEVRPISSLSANPSMLGPSAVFYWHRLSLQKDLEALYSSFHKNCVRRKIRRAEREGLTYEEGRTEKLIHQFYRLLLATHRRHGLPPQPIAWFRNLLDCLGSGIKIRVAYKEEIAVASMITLKYKQTMIYKYGCSDAKYHNLGGMAFLFWQAIQDAKAAGLDEFDMGRSDCDNAGLIRFKENWGPGRSTLVYWGSPPSLRLNPNMWCFRFGRKLIGALPEAVLPAIGRLSYKHLA